MTSPEQRKAEWSERLQPRHWSVPVKLVAVIAVPTVLAIALGVLRVLDQSSAASTFGQVDRIVELQERFSALTTSLQTERDEAAQFVAVRERRDEAPLQAAFAATDTARGEAVTALGDQAGLSSGTVGALRQVENTYFQLTQLRRQVVTGANDAGDLVAQYGAVIEPLLVFDDTLTRQLGDPEISGLAQALGALGAAREQVSAQKALVNAVIAARVLRPEQSDALRSADTRLIAATTVVRSVLNPDQLQRYTAFTGAENAEREQLKQSVLTRGRAGLPIDIQAAAWNERSDAVLKQITEAEDGARAELQTVSAAQQDEASNLAGVNSVMLLLTLLVAALVAFLVGRALVTSLRTLRRTALDVADRRLPEAVKSMREGAVPDIQVAPVPVTTREEVGQVARAFDAVHSQAVRLAAEQATLQSSVSSMFANLSRRTQALAERQLKLIEKLESNEQDPDQLSNLFQLDSLATRMRRNSENLLVLSGTDLSKRGLAPVPVLDVLHAAVSEIEQYQRVVVQSPPEATIAGRATSDLVHLLAELLDNATNFSAPDTQVVMSSQRTPDGSVLIEIVDRGVGMGGPELDDANARLARPTAIDVSVSRRMGLFVVARLASRHGMGVRLTGGGAGGGTTASVSVPAHLVTPAGGAAPPQPPQSPKPPVSAPNGLPGTEFQPLQRPGANGSRGPASLSSLVAGADAPVGDPAGPAPANGLTWPKPAVNGAPSEPPHANGLPTRRPGQFLRQNQNPPRPAPPDEPPATPEPAPAVGPDERGPAPQEPAQEPVQEPAKKRTAGPATEEAAPPGDTPAPPVPPGPDALPRRVPAAPPTRTEAPAPAGSTLFAPIISPETGAPPERDPMSETTPIFEEVASAWFRADRPIPVSYDDRTGLYRDPAPAPGRPASLPPLPGPGAAAPPPVAPPPVAPPPVAPPQVAPAPNALAPPAPPAAAAPAAPGASTFASAADDGWRASAAAASSRPDELTSAGLPKRRPRARLVPGAAAPAGPPAVAPARTADAIRGRLASYQDGVRQGREDRLRRSAAAAAGRPGEGTEEEVR